MFKSHKYKYLLLVLSMIILGVNNFTIAKNIDYKTDIKAIKILYKNWHNAVMAGDIDGYINSLDQNISLIPPLGPVVTGVDNYRKFLKPIFKSTSYKIEAGEYDIEIRGDIAIVKNRTKVHLTYKDNKNNILPEGALNKNVTTSDYLDILKRQENGSWKCLVHSWQEVAIN